MSWDNDLVIRLLRESDEEYARFSLTPELNGSCSQS